MSFYTVKNLASYAYLATVEAGAVSLAHGGVHQMAATALVCRGVRADVDADNQTLSLIESAVTEG